MKNGLRTALTKEQREILESEAEVLQLKIETTEAEKKLLTKKLIAVTKQFKN